MKYLIVTLTLLLGIAGTAFGQEQAAAVKTDAPCDGTQSDAPPSDKKTPPITTPLPADSKTKGT